MSTTENNISLPVIHYDALVQKDQTEISKLIEASIESGFFYLKLDNEVDPDQMFKLAENAFQIPLDDNLLYEMDAKNGGYYGYKPAGTMLIDKNGNPDAVEYWNISKDDILVRDATTFPQVILDAKDTIRNFMTKSHGIACVILEILSMDLGLDSQVLPNLHRLYEASGDQVRLTKSTMYPIQSQNVPDVCFGGHTDAGTVTVLFNRLYGLQILSTKKEWLYIPPLSGHAVVNLGDAMVKLSGGRFKSSTHRVVTAPDLKQVTDRYSVIYFARPENSVLMKSLVGDDDEASDADILTIQEWIARRGKNWQVANYKDENSFELSRGTENREV